MFKCLYIAGHVFLITDNHAVNLNNMTEAYMGTQRHDRGNMVFRSDRTEAQLDLDVPLYELLEECDRQATQKLMGEQQ